MKKAFVLSALLFAMVAFAKPYPPEQLKKINAYIASLMGNYGKLEVTRAELGKDNLVSRTDIVASYDETSGSIQVALKGKKVELRAAATEADVGDTPENLERDLLELAKKINAKGVYKAVTKITKKADQTSYQLKVTPASEQAISIEALKVALTVGSGGRPSATYQIDGRFNLSSELILDGRQSLTTIMEKLSQETFPEIDDYSGLYKIYLAIADFIED